jgi:hypothetical protein
MSLNRKLVRNRNSIWVSLPKDLVSIMEWKPGDSVFVYSKDFNRIMIERRKKK